MAGNDTIATLGVDLVGRDISASATIDKVKGKAEEATGTFDRLGMAATKVQSIVSKILIPVALFSSISSAIALFDRLYDKIKAIVDLLDSASVGSEDLLLGAVRQTDRLTEATKRALAVSIEFEAQQKKIEEASEKVNTVWFSIVNLAAQYNTILGGMSPTIDQINDGLQNASNRITDQKNEAIELLDRMEKQVAASKKLAENTAELAELEGAIVALKDEQLEAGDRAIAQVNRQMAAISERIAMEQDPAQLSALFDLFQQLSEKYDRLRKQQADATAADTQKRLEDEAKVHADRLRKLEEFERKLRDSITGGIFGEGAVAGGNIGALTSAISQIADKLGGAR